MTVDLGAVAGASIRLVGDDTLVIEDLALEELHFSTDIASMPAATRDALEAFLVTLVRGVLDDSLGSALPALPIPAFELPDSLSDFGIPGGSELGLRSPTMVSTPTHFVVEGNFGVR